MSQHNNQQFHQDLMRHGHYRMAPTTPQQESDREANLQHNLVMTKKETRFFEEKQGLVKMIRFSLG
jgi:hypothetical protein